MTKDDEGIPAFGGIESGNASTPESLEDLRARRDERLRAIYKELTPWDTVRVARHRHGLSWMLEEEASWAHGGAEGGASPAPRPRRCADANTPQQRSQWSGFTYFRMSGVV